MNRRLASLTCRMICCISNVLLIGCEISFPYPQWVNPLDPNYSPAGDDTGVMPEGNGGGIVNGYLTPTPAPNGVVNECSVVPRIVALDYYLFSYPKYEFRVDKSIVIGTSLDEMSGNFRYYYLIYEWSGVPIKTPAAFTVKIDSVTLAGRFLTAVAGNLQYSGSADHPGSCYGSIGAPGDGLILHIPINGTPSSPVVRVIIVFENTPISEPTAVEAPAFNPVPSIYGDAQTISITSATADASISYTTDGSDPTSTNGTLIANGGSVSVSVNPATTLKAIAIKDGMVDSPVMAGEYWNYATRMVHIPAGTFQMGQMGITEPVHEVTMSPFSIGKYEVTQEAYRAVMGSNPSAFTSNTDADACPVDRVSWYDTLVFCNTLSLLEGLTPVYSIGGSSDPAAWGAIPTNGDSLWDAVVMNMGVNGYRLPTEAEWEYAARGGTTTTSYWGDSTADATADYYAWYYYNSTNITHGVGQKTPNAYQLYDTAGNLREWCWDWYVEYPGGIEIDPVGSSSGSSRVGRGGSWGDSSINLRSACRGAAGPDYRGIDFGFRVAKRNIVSAPAFSPPPGLYFSNTVVTITSATTGASVSYTTDGSTPSRTNGTIIANGGMVTVGVDPATLLRTTAFLDGMNDSMVTSGEYWRYVSTMVDIPAGTFMMGQVGIAEPVHEVMLSAFRIGKYEVTQQVYQAVIGMNPSYGTSNSDAPNCPVEQVSWYDALVFCNRLSLLEGLMPVYSITGTTDTSAWGTVPTVQDAAWDAVIMDQIANGYRLPTEAEWEYAARAGTASTYYWGEANDDGAVSQYAWDNANSGYSTHAVGSKTPNAFGLYDTAGNVWEWTWDWDGRYTGEAQTNPVGPVTGSNRSRRGGCLYYSSELLKTALQNADHTYIKNWGVGFRIVSRPGP